MKLTYGEFEKLRLGPLFPDASFPWAQMAAGESTESFDTEYLGQQWHVDEIPGVQFYFSRRAKSKLTIISVKWHFSKDEEDEPWEMSELHHANIDVCLRALGFPTEFTASQNSIDRLFLELPPPAMQRNEFTLYKEQIGDPDSFLVNVTAVEGHGVIEIGIAHPQLLTGNAARYW